MQSSPPAQPPLVTLRRGGIATLELRRPARRNALSRELVLALGDALRDLAEDPSVRVIVLQGSSGSFCSGADLSAIQGLDSSDLGARIDEFHALILGICRAPQPVIASIDGPAVGFGADLALACDVRLMSENAYLQESFVDIGLMPDGGGTHWAPLYFGAQAFEILALGQRLPAARCHALGLTGTPVPVEELPQATHGLGVALAQKPPLALMRIKQALQAGRMEALSHALAREKAGQVQLLGSADFREGVQAFLEKRAAVFKGE